MRRRTFAFLSLTIFGFASAVSAQAPPIGATCTVFPANNIWNTAVDQLPVAANSSTYVNTIGAATGVHPDFGSGTYGGGPIGIPFITVPGTQTKYPATFTYADESDPGPYAIPLNAPIEGGSASTGDRHAISVDTDNCILYELYAAYPQASSWQAGSGAIFNLLSNASPPFRMDIGGRGRVCRSSPAWFAMTKSSRARSATRSVSRFRRPRRPTCGPRATMLRA